MELDYNKIAYKDMDKDSYPLQVIYNYDLTQDEISELVANYVMDTEIPKGVAIREVELLLTIYSRHDCKLEAVYTGYNDEQYWVEMAYHLTNAGELIQMIPDYGKIKLDDLPRI